MRSPAAKRLFSRPSVVQDLARANGLRENAIWTFPLKNAMLLSLHLVNDGATEPELEAFLNTVRQGGIMGRDLRPLLLIFLFHTRQSSENNKFCLDHYFPDPELVVFSYQRVPTASCTCPIFWCCDVPCHPFTPPLLLLSPPLFSLTRPKPFVYRSRTSRARSCAFFLATALFARHAACISVEGSKRSFHRLQGSPS